MVLFPDSKAEFGFPVIWEYPGSFWNMGRLEFIFNKMNLKKTGA